MADDTQRLLRQFEAHFKWLERQGVQGIPIGQREAAPVAEAAGKQKLTLEVIREDLGECTRCKLHPTRKNIVFGVGNPHANLMFIGEAPGYDEDQQGEPFVGKAGQLLNKMIVAMGLAREDVYIGNILKCLRYNTPVQLENRSWERIGRLVAQKYSGRVMSIASDGTIVPKRVIGWYRSPLADRPVYRMSYASSAVQGGNRAITWLTGDHEVMTRNGWKRADALNENDEVAVGQGLSRVAYEVAVGSLLGDGGIPRIQALLTFGHCRDQREYVHWKARSLGELEPILDDAEVTNQVAGRKYLVSRCRTRASRALRVLRRRFYGTDGKRVPRDLVLTPRIVAIWFLDDGYTKIKSDNLALAEIAAHSFSADDIQFLIERLKSDVSLEGYIRASSPGRIHFGSEATRRLSEIVAPYCPPCLRYKLHRAAERRIPFDETLYDAGQPETLFDSAVIEHVPDFDGTDKTFFCIDVEDTHNFVTAGGVVHNCRPPQNRNPEPDEIEQCEPFLRKQIDAIAPRILVALGKFAAQTLLRSDAPISALRGHWHTYQGIPLMPTFHPAFLLRSPDKKREAWSDLQLVMGEMRRLGLYPEGK